MGSWTEQYYSTQDVIDRIETVSNIIPLEKVLVGWCLDPEPYMQIGEYLHGKGIQMLLYLPVFSETEEACDNKPAVDIWGKVPENYDVENGFRFTCPSDPQNIANIIALYEQNLADVPFDGVFLDRIRTQSFVTGVQGVLNCGCPVCEAQYAELGVDLAQVRAAYEEKGDKFFNVTSYTPQGGWEFEDPLAAAFFKAKGVITSSGVAKVADFFRDRGMIVGLDLYAPLMAQFVGQDYELLCQHADFIKPMLYRRTFAPAGIGYEYDLLKKSIPQAEGYPDIEMDLDFLNGQLDALKDLPCRKFPGIEIIYVDKLAPTDPDYILESLRAVKEYGYDGSVVSWNIMQVPDEHIRCLNEL
jgi:Dihydroorotate dehydrogenase